MHFFIPVLQEMRLKTSFFFCLLITKQDKTQCLVKKSLGSEVIYFTSLKKNFVDIRIKTGYMKQIYEVRPINSFFKFSLWLVFSLYFVFVTFQVVKEYDFVKNELNHPLFGDQDKLLAVVQIFSILKTFLKHSFTSFEPGTVFHFNQQSAREQRHKNYSLSLATTLENLSHFM